jgi:hypothetical protein
VTYLKVQFPQMSGRGPGKTLETLVRVINIPVEIRTGYLHNISRIYCCLSQLLNPPRMGSVLCRWGLNPQPSSRLVARLTLAETNEQGTEAGHASKIFCVDHCEPGLENLLNKPGTVIYSKLTGAHVRNLKTKFISNMKGLTP